MKIAISGATGLVGYPVAKHLAAVGHDVTTLGRLPLAGVPHLAWELGAPVDLAGFDALVHAGFSHAPGRYRGGEGDDPVGFLKANLDGTLALFNSAHRAGVRVIFASSRAVYGPYPAGVTLHETMAARPDTLYGQVKLQAEEALKQGDVSLRITGVFGPPVPGRLHKWADLFADFRTGCPIAPRVATEVHVHDVALAVEVAIHHPSPPNVVNVSGFVLDRQDLLLRVAQITGVTHPLPDRADATALNVMDTSRLEDMSWRASGVDTLDNTLRGLLRGD